MIGAANGPRRHMETPGNPRHCIPFSHHVGLENAFRSPIIRFCHPKGDKKDAENNQENACKNNPLES